MKEELNDDYNNRNIKMNSPAIYQIKVQGKMSSTW
jgi:hypothetical protein